MQEKAWSEMTDIKKLRELAGKATPGPWAEKRDPFDVERIHIVDQEDLIICSVRGTTRNCEFIATANPQVIIELLDRLERYDNALRFIANSPVWKSEHEGIQHTYAWTSVNKAREALEGGK